MDKKEKKVGTIIINVLIILCFITFLFIGFSVYLISNIETEIRYLAIATLLFINIVLFLFTRKTIKNKKVIGYIVMSVICFILVGVQAVGGYYIFKTYSSINSINKNNLVYSTGVVVLTDSKIDDLDDLKDMKIGMIEDASSISNYVLGKAIIDEKKLEDNNKILYYDESSVLVKDLYDEKVDAIIINDEYVKDFIDIESYKDIEKDTKIIFTKEKKYTKDEIAEITGTKVNTNKASIEEPFTMLLLGMDSQLSGRSDTMIVVTFNPKTLNATMLSIPRDSYVKIKCSSGTSSERKINSAGSCLTTTIENLLDVNIDYYAKINFSGIVQLVEAMGGVEVDVPYSFCEQNSRRQWGTNTVYVKKGMQTLNGEQALALARNRHVWKDRCSSEYTSYTNRSDFVRGKNQQLVIQSMIKKLKTINSPAQLLDILDAVSSNMDTDLSTDQILYFYNIAKDIVKTSSQYNDSIIQFDRLYLKTSNQYIYHSASGLSLSNEIINQDSLKQVKNAMKNNLGKTTPKVTKSIDFSVKEPYEASIIGENPAATTKLFTLIPNFTRGYTRSSITNWCNSNGLTVTFEDFETSESKYSDGQILSQSIPATSRLDQVNKTTGITIRIVKKVTVITPEEPETEEPVAPTEPTPEETPNEDTN